MATELADAQDDGREIELPWDEVVRVATELRQHLRRELALGKTDELRVYGVPRGGCAVAALVGKPVDAPAEAMAIVDDVIDSGSTEEKYAHHGLPFRALFDKRLAGAMADRWLVFPWDRGSETTSVQDAVRRLIQWCGQDATAPGLMDTPDRVARAFREMTAGYHDDPAQLLSAIFVTPCDEMVVVRDIPFWSLCEHHLLPFHGTATVGYLPGHREGGCGVVGLSKLARLVQCHARRLQLQERMTQEIAQSLWVHVDALGCGVVVSAEHTCMASRGVRTQGRMVTSALRGAFKEDAAVRDEFLRLGGL